MSKRKINNDIYSLTKKIKYADIPISASSIRNYMLNDPLVDYLDEYNIKNISKYNMKNGISFENKLMETIKKNHNVVSIDKITQYNQTIELMKNGESIIYQGVLYNEMNNTFGVPDLLVRSDYINKLLNYDVVTNDESRISSNKLKTNFHYKVIDIKNINIPFRSNNKHILNSDSIPYYKGQLYIYLKALNNIQGININKCYIWGKNDKLGEIDYDNIDSEYIQKTNNAIEWIKQLKKEGSNWKLFPLPSRPELYPNMKSDNDKYKYIKTQINNKVNDITSVWYCGIKQRQLAHKHNIYSWTDKKCNATIMGFTGKRAIIVDSILDINRQDTDLIRPNKITYDKENWFNKETDIMEFYFDFETINENGCLTFLIGVGYNENNNWIFNKFLSKQKNNYSEKEMFIEFCDYINNILKINKKKKAKLYHWTNAEITFINRFITKNQDIKNNFDNFCYYDLYNIFISEPVVIKGAMDFSLKTIAKAIYKHNLIKSYWDTNSQCSNGLSAMVLAIEIYNKNILVTETNETMKEIIYYNEIDCKILYEIHELLKNKT